MLSGWGAQTRRYGRELGRLPLVVFLCRDMARARDCVRCVDTVLVACQAYAGEYPSEWLYLGRRQVVYAAERDVHEGRLRALGVPPLPPDVRVDAAGGDPTARACEPVVCDLGIELRRAPASGVARKG